MRFLSGTRPQYWQWWWAKFIQFYKFTLAHTQSTWILETLRPRQKDCHFADDIFKCIFENENEWISPGISLTFVPKVRINNIPALVHIMVWRRPGDKPLSEPMMIILLTHICVTRPQWVKAQTKRPPFCRQHFQINFLVRKSLKFYSNFTKI